MHQMATNAIVARRTPDKIVLVAMLFLIVWPNDGKYRREIAEIAEGHILHTANLHFTLLFNSLFPFFCFLRCWSAFEKFIKWCRYFIFLQYHIWKFHVNITAECIFPKPQMNTRWKKDVCLVYFHVRISERSIDKEQGTRAKRRWLGTLQLCDIKFL